MPHLKGKKEMVVGYLRKKIIWRRDCMLVVHSGGGWHLLVEELVVMMAQRGEDNVGI
jgi:hypothetical protein